MQGIISSIGPHIGQQQGKVKDCCHMRCKSVTLCACNGTSIASAASAMQMPAHIKLISLLPNETWQHEERRAPTQQGVHTAGRQRQNKVGPVWP